MISTRLPTRLKSHLSEDRCKARHNHNLVEKKYR